MDEKTKKMLGLLEKYDNNEVMLDAIYQWITQATSPSDSKRLHYGSKTRNGYGYGEKLREDEEVLKNNIKDNLAVRYNLKEEELKVRCNKMEEAINSIKKEFFLNGLGDDCFKEMKAEVINYFEKHLIFKELIIEKFKDLSNEEQKQVTDFLKEYEGRLCNEKVELGSWSYPHKNWLKDDEDGTKTKLLIWLGLLNDLPKIRRDADSRMPVLTIPCYVKYIAPELLLYETNIDKIEVDLKKEPSYLSISKSALVLSPNDRHWRKGRGFSITEFKMTGIDHKAFRFDSRRRTSHKENIERLKALQQNED